MESENYVRIFTDSQATLQALHNPHVTSKLIEETQLNLLGQTVKSLTIHWIEAHKEKGNQREAHRATTRRRTKSSPACPGKRRTFPREAP